MMHGWQETVERTTLPSADDTSHFNIAIFSLAGITVLAAEQSPAKRLFL